MAKKYLKLLTAFIGQIISSGYFREEVFRSQTIKEAKLPEF